MPANRMAVLQRFTLERVAIISVSMLDRLCDRAEFLCAFAYLNKIRKRKFRPKAGGKPLAASFRYAGKQEHAIRKQVVRLAPRAGGILRSARKVRLRETWPG